MRRRGLKYSVEPEELAFIGTTCMLGQDQSTIIIREFINVGSR